MAVDEARRSRLYERLARAIGPDEATTMFELLPPAGTDLATRADIDMVDQRFEAVDRRFEAVDRRFDAVDHRFDAIDQRFESLEGELREMRADLRGLRGEVTAAISTQSRAVVLGVLTATVSIGGLTAVFSQLF